MYIFGAKSTGEKSECLVHVVVKLKGPSWANSPSLGVLKNSLDKPW